MLCRWTTPPGKNTCRLPPERLKPTHHSATDANGAKSRRTLTSMTLATPPDDNLGTVTPFARVSCQGVVVR